MKYVDIMKCPKEEKVLLGIIGGLAHYWGINPNKLRLVLVVLSLMTLFISTQAFFISLFCYGCSFLITPTYEPMYDKEVTPDAEPPDFF